MIRIEATIDGKPLVLEAKSLSDMTVGELASLFRPEGDDDAAAYAKYLGVDEDRLRAIPSHALTKIEDAYTAALVDLAKARAQDPTPLPRVYQFDGEDWVMPQDIEHDCNIGQLLSLERDLSGIDSEVEAIPYIFAHLCSVDAADVASNVERFKALPALDGIQWYAFFLTSSERLRNAMRQVGIRYLKSSRQAIVRALTALLPDGDHGERSLPLPEVPTSSETSSAQAQTER